MIERARLDRDLDGILVHDLSRFSRDSVQAKTLVRELRARGIEVASVSDPEVDPESVAGVYLEAITFAKNEAYSREVAFHTRKGCRANLRTRDEETGWCYKNGGAPLWGFRTERVQRGVDRRGAPVMKSIWLRNETVVAGRPVWEWARHVLVDLRAGQHASMDTIRDFLNEHEVPSPRKRYWSPGSIHSLLQPPALLQYEGFAVWNVHAEHGRHRPPSEWEIVEEAHPAIITL